MARQHLNVVIVGLPGEQGDCEAVIIADPDEPRTCEQCNKRVTVYTVDEHGIAVCMKCSFEDATDVLPA